MSKLASIFWILLGSAALSGVSAVELELSADSDVVGETQVIEAQYEDTFIKLARRYNLGWAIPGRIARSALEERAWTLAAVLLALLPVVGFVLALRAAILRA